MYSTYTRLVHYKSRFSSTIFSELKRIKKLKAKKLEGKTKRKVLIFEQAKKNTEESQKQKPEQFKLCIYYHNVLRYTIFGNLEKAQELRNQGFYVDVKRIPKEVVEKPA